MRKPSKLTVILFFVCVCAAFGLTKVTSVLIQNSQIVNSTINSTSIGSTSPSTAYFQSQMAANSPITPNQQGAYLGWNQSGGAFNGDMDFLDQRGQGSGGFSWFIAGVNNQIIGTPMTLDASGNLAAARSVAAPSFVGTLTGNVNGNASSADVLSNSPTQCGVGTGQYAIGVQANGNANCVTYGQSLGSPGYLTLPSNVSIEFGRTALVSGNGDFIALPHVLSSGLFVVTASDAGAEGNPTTSQVYTASAVIDPATAKSGFFAYEKDHNGNFVGGVISWVAIGQ